MKQVSSLIYILSTTIVLFSFTSIKSDIKYKRYGVETGYISYIYEGQAYGDKKVYFKDWGMTEIQIDNMHLEVFGMKQKTHHVVFMKDTDITIHNKATKKTHKEENTEIASLIRNNPKEKDLSKCAYDELEKSGGKKLGTEIYLDKECELWEINGSKQLNWKGIPLKTELEIANMKITMRAVELKTNIVLHDSIFDIQKKIN